MLPLAAELLVQLSAPDRRAAADLCVAHIESGTSLRELVEKSLAPAMAEVGGLWQAAIWSVVDEHIATGVAETALSAAARCDRRTSASGEIVVACVEGDWHSLPSRMVAEVLDGEGWSVRFLGASHPTSMLTDYVRRHRPEAVLLSCAVPMALPALVGAVHALHELDTKVFVGGRALGTTPYRAAAVGADGWAAGAPTSELLAQPMAAARPVAAFTRLDEHRDLQRLLPAWSESAMTRLSTLMPAVASFPARAQERTQADLHHLLDMASIAWLLEDESLMIEQCQWLADVLAAYGVPPEALPHGLTALLDTEPGSAIVAGLRRQLVAGQAAIE